MKLKALIVAVLMALASSAHALTLSDLRNQVIDQTKLTIHREGGPAVFYDASSGNDFSLKEGIVSHVLTNRWLTADLGYWTADNQSSIVIGGLGVKAEEALTAIAPSLAVAITQYIPPVIRPLSLGAFGGWDSQNGSFHWGAHLAYMFGGPASE